MVLAGLFSIIWSSPYALLIGVLAPALALGHWVESRRRHYRATQEAEASYQSALGEWEQETARDKRAFLQRALAQSPHPTQWRDHPLWRPVVVDGQRQVRVGLTAAPGPGDRVVAGVPALVGMSHGIAVVGSSDLAHGLWRVVVLGVCSHLVRSAPPIHPETLWGPTDAPRDSIAVSDNSSGEIIALRVDDVLDVPIQVGVVLLVGHDLVQLVVDGVHSGAPFRPDTITVGASRWVIDDLSTQVPHTPEVTSRAPDPDDRSALFIRLSPEFWLDMVDAGPHAVIWGQTGSGKSVLIRQIIHSIAGFYRPDQVTVVVIDFKGGMGSSATAEYPHVVGVLSDLMPFSVCRVEDGIKAEIRRREHILSSARVNSVSELEPERALPRTVIIVDEVATLIQQHPHWELLLNDLASRGRALGLHLISASQRVAGQIPRTVMVNSPLRICLRVSDSQEAGDFLPGVPAQTVATRLGAPPGTALVLDASGTHHTLRVEEHPPKRTLPGVAPTLWCEPLPTLVEQVPTALAVLDRPDRQDQPQIGVRDVPPGLLWVGGDGGRGLSRTLARWTEMQRDHLVVPDDPARLIDTLRQLRQGTLAPPSLVVAEHLDRTLENEPSATIQWCVDALVATARAQRRMHSVSHVVVGTGLRGECASLLARSADSSWRLVPTQRDAWRDSGLPRGLFDADAPPGRALIDGALAQVVLTQAPLQATEWAEDHSYSVASFDLVISGGPHDTTNQREGVLVIATHECDRYLAEIDQAYRRGTLGLQAVGITHLAPFIRHNPPLPDPGKSGIWQVGVNGWRLCALPD